MAGTQGQGQKACEPRYESQTREAASSACGSLISKHHRQVYGGEEVSWSLADYANLNTVSVAADIRGIDPTPLLQFGLPESVAASVGSRVGEAMIILERLDGLLNMEIAAEGNCCGAEPNNRNSRRERNATEQAIIDALLQMGATGFEAVKSMKKRPTGEQLADIAIGRKCDGQFKATLKHLVDLGWLDNGRYHGIGSGYFLTEVGAKLATVHRKSGPGQD